MPAEGDWPDPDIPQDPGIPGSKTPDELPPDEGPEVDDVPDAEQPDVDDEGQMTPPAGSQRRAQADELPPSS